MSKLLAGWRDTWSTSALSAIDLRLRSDHDDEEDEDDDDRKESDDEEDEEEEDDGYSE